jgi:chromosome partitioning protein
MSVSSLKGGVGKTTVALGLASAAFARGLRTLVVDLDPQCDASTGLGAIGEFRETVADVLQNPKHNIVHRSIVASTWGKVQAGHIDVMIGSPRALKFDTPNPTIRDVWKLEEALSRIEKEYDLVLIDTPPSINGLTRTAWVASDRVLIVSEPSIFSVVAADRAMRAIEELRKGLTPRLQALGVVINRLRPQSKEHAYRAHELEEMFRENLMTVQIEERATIQQAQGAARPIHTWPGDHAAELANIFDEILATALESFQQPENSKRIKLDKKYSRISKIMRGQNLDAVLELESLQSDSFAAAGDSPLSELGISELGTSETGFDLPTQPAKPINLDNLTALEKLEALAMLELDQQNEQKKNEES